MAETIDAQVTGIMRRLSDDAKRVLVRGVAKAAAYTAGEIATHLIDSGAGPGPLSRSFRAEPISIERGHVSAWARSIGSAEVYAGIQNDGGTIRPKTRRHLAVPIKGAGIAKGKWPRHFGAGELKLIPRRGRPSLLVAETGARKRVIRHSKGRTIKAWARGIKPMFVLMPSVRIRPKHYLDAVSARVGDTIDRIIAKAWDAEVK